VSTPSAESARLLAADPVSLAAKDVHLSFGSNAVLRGVDLEVPAGSTAAIIGPSGSGKSTLLHVIGTLERPSSGVVRIGGVDAAQLDDRALSRLRAREIGFVFQQFFLAEHATVRENVADGLLYAGAPAAERYRRADEALERVGLSHRATFKPTKLSGGERQRVAIAAAAAGGARVLLLDEPTRGIDVGTKAAVHALMSSLAAQGMAILMISSELPEILGMSDRIAVMRAGRISGTLSREEATQEKILSLALSQ
jgi:putative ABC transport system ATP-binding protein